MLSWETRNEVRLNWGSKWSHTLTISFLSHIFGPYQKQWNSGLRQIWTQHQKLGPRYQLLPPPKKMGFGHFWTQEQKLESRSTPLTDIWNFETLSYKLELRNKSWKVGQTPPTDTWDFGILSFFNSVTKVGGVNTIWALSWLSQCYFNVISFRLSKNCMKSSPTGQGAPFRPTKGQRKKYEFSPLHLKIDHMFWLILVVARKLSIT